MTTFITPYQPKHRKLSPEVILYRHVPGKDIGDDKIDISTFVRSINISSDMNNPYGSMNIAFVPTVLEHGHISVQDQLHAIKRNLSIYQVISVKIDRESEEYNFFGLVDHYYESTSTKNGSVGRNVTANCSMLIPKLLTRDALPNAPILQNDEKVKKNLGEARTQFLAWLRGTVMEDGKLQSPFLNRDPIQAIKYILQNAPSTVDYKGILKFNKLDDILNYTDIHDDMVYDIRTLATDLLFDPSLSTFTGNIIAYISACLDRAFYEFYFETVTAKEGNRKYPHNKITIRPIPFSYKLLAKNKNFGVSSSSKNHDGGTDNRGGYGYWEDLTTVMLDSGKRLDENLGINDYEIGNYFVLNYQNSLLLSNTNGLLGSFYPVMDFFLIKKYGFRPVEMTTTAINKNELFNPDNTRKEQKTDNDVKEHIKLLLEKRNKIVEWYGFPFYESGQIVVVGNPAYKVGRKLRYVSREFFDPLGFFDEKGNFVFNPQSGSSPNAKRIYKGMEYYINKVEHRFTYPDLYTTTIGVTRGQAIAHKDGQETTLPAMVLDYRGNLGDDSELAYYFKSITEQK